MKLISDEKLVAIRTDVYQDEDRDKYAGNCIVTAAYAQLESCEKEKNKEINTLLTECKEYHNAVVKEIFEEIEAKDYYGGTDEVAIMIEKVGWQALKQKYGGK